MWTFCITLFMVAATSTSAAEICPENSAWTNNACNTKCSEIGIKLECSNNAEPGCKCTMPHNFFTNSGKCVHKFACPDNEVVCPKNMTYHTCGDCAKTCQQMYQSTSCLYECQTGCQCSEHFYRTESGNCVEAKDCPQEEIKCYPGLEIKFTDGILKTCLVKDSKNKDDLEKSIPTCACSKADEVYDMKTKSCIQKTDCEALRSGRICRKVNCIPECSNYHYLCTEDCTWECYCKEGCVFNNESKICENNVEI